MAEPWVLVTAIGGAGTGEQIVKALRMDGRAHIIGADLWPSWPRFRDVDVALTLPSPTSPGYVDAVAAVCERWSVRMVFPGSEPELRVLVAERERLESSGLRLAACDAATLGIALDKVATAQHLQDTGFDAPRTMLLRRDVEVPADWFPVVVKPAAGGSGSRDCHIAQTAEELDLVERLLTTQGVAGLAVQEYVGTPDQEYTVGVLHDLDGNFVNSIVLRRRLVGQMHVRVRVPNRTDKAELGRELVISSGISHGEISTMERIAGPCEAVARSLQTRGPLNVQCRLAEGKVVVFEVNPRFSGTSSLRALMGFNEPVVLIDKHVRGRPMEVRFPYRSGLVLRSLAEGEPPTHPALPWAEA